MFACLHWCVFVAVLEGGCGWLRGASICVSTEACMGACLALVCSCALVFWGWGGAWRVQYHMGYREQVAKWPLNPLDVLIQCVRSVYVAW